MVEVNHRSGGRLYADYVAIAGHTDLQISGRSVLRSTESAPERQERGGISRQPDLDQEPLVTLG
jgi:hypothetical protein